jgi:hypothetical protein
MKAVGYKEKGSIDREDSLIDIDLPKPSATGQDLLVEIKAISVNPVDYKIRSWMSAPEGEYRVLGWDACGIVVEKGPLAQGFEIGDRVYYAGALDRPGTNAEYNLAFASGKSYRLRTLSCRPERGSACDSREQQERHRTVQKGDRRRPSARPRLGRTVRRTPAVDDFRRRPGGCPSRVGRRSATSRRDRSGRRHGPCASRLRPCDAGKLCPRRSRIR